MKHLFSFLLLFGVVAALTAQTIVSTTPAPKNVVLEEYTGANCPYCPDGHRIANELMEQYPGQVFGINIHQGSYAPTSPASENYTTAFGDALAGQTGLTGYPCGTVNRHVFASPAPMTAGGTAHSRANWGTIAGQIMAVTSPVNVAIDATLNEATRELSILVEVYYTSSSATTTNALNIAVLQDYVVGPQVGSSYNPDYIIGSDYYHMHMLRNLIFGQWGVTIPTTTAGTFYDTAFVYTIPAAYGAITAELFNLKFVAFVSEGHQEILSADEFKILAPLDASVHSIASIPAIACTGTFTPTVTLVNNGTTTITSANINYSLDGGAASLLTYSGTLLSGEDTVITLPAMTVTTNGSHTLDVDVSSPNGLTDNLAFNNATTASFVTFLTNITAPLQQPFTSTTFPPADWSSFDASGDGTNWSRGTAGHTAAGSAFINFYNIGSGAIDDLMVSPADFSTMTNASMTFWVAYRQYSSENDKIQVDVSTNCGTTWVTKWNKSGSSLATGADVTSNWTSPTAAEWREELIDLSDYDGMSDVMVRIRATSAYGNNLFLDDVNIDEALGLEQSYTNSFLSVYPNPAVDQITISLEAVDCNDALITISNSLGEIVYSNVSSMTSGVNLIDINTSSFANGNYFVSIQSGAQAINSTFVIGR